MNEPFEIRQDIKTALARGNPVIAIESTVIAHGLPDGKGAEAALSMTKAANAEGCLAAVIGIIEGKVKIGLSEDEINHLATAEDVMKVSTREIADAVVSKRDGATTVAGTVHLAAAAGIPVVATGGIGGVHRGASESWDISADLTELARTRALVVCSGAKSVLDLRATVEWMETHQVPVYGYGTDELPAFYSQSSGISVPMLDTPEDVSELFLTRIGLGLRCGMVLGVPIPKKDAVDVGDAIEEAVESAKSEGVRGAALTPWLLARVQELSGGGAVKANLSLLANNARVAAQVAAALAGKRDKRIGFH
jgi:pseudouridylate synthase